MKKLFEEIRVALARGENTVLCTVLVSMSLIPKPLSGHRSFL